jgi:Raf kinase inhibitor-like YbhB/YbcL family protein
VRPRVLGLIGLFSLFGLVACGGSQQTPEEGPAVTAPDVITVTSTAFQPTQPIPPRFSCDGANVSPPLAWSGVPPDAKAVALVVDDPDAPRGTFTHWVLLDIPSETTSIAEDVVPPGATQATNSAGKASYFGPCPPSGTHHYRFTIYALSAESGLSTGAPLDRALAAIDGAAIAKGQLVGIYTRA